MELYRKALAAWGFAMPEQLKNLTDRSDEAVYSALNDVIGDMFSAHWVADSRIAWALMQGREPNCTRQAQS